MTHKITWYVAVPGTDATANERVVAYLQTEPVVKECRLKSGRTGDVRLYEVKDATDVSRLRNGDSRFPLEFYRQTGDNLPHYHEFDKKAPRKAPDLPAVFRGSELLGRNRRPRRALA